MKKLMFVFATMAFFMMTNQVAVAQHASKQTKAVKAADTGDEKDVVDIAIRRLGRNKWYYPRN